MALKSCKECNEEISSSTKKCPKCGKDQRNFFMKHKALTIIGAIVIIGVLGSVFGGNDNADVSAGNNTISEANVGDVITTDKYEIVITDIQERNSVGNEYFKSSASEGGKYVVVSWRYKNISNEPISSFSTPTVVLVDGNGVTYKSDIDASGNYATEVNLDRKVFSDLNPGITVNDANVFEVSKEQYDVGGWKVKVDADKDCLVPAN